MQVWNISYSSHKSNILLGFWLASLAIFTSSGCYAADGGGVSFWDRVLSFAGQVIPAAFEVGVKASFVAVKVAMVCLL